jgi:predicted RNA-binding Zn-ribbon protein involved in translation (DUF1610 family)
MKHIDRRYMTKYRASLIQNLVMIKENGMENFLELEVKKWTCPDCGSTTSVHNHKCLSCGRELRNASLQTDDHFIK